MRLFTDYITGCVSPRELTYGKLVPCGKCEPCVWSRRREWASRILQEAESHSFSFFGTFTLRDEHLTYTPDGLATLNYGDWTRFRDRCRKTALFRRQFAVAEYGDTTERPHFHAALFGCRPDDAAELDKAWGLGFTQFDSLCANRAHYLAGYVAKKLTRGDDARLRGRQPEKTFMSRNPGIGAGFADQTADQLSQHPATRPLMASEQELASTCFRRNGRVFPIGKYGKKRMRQRLGLPEAAADRGGAKLRNPTSDELVQNGQRSKHRQVRALRHSRKL